MIVFRYLGRELFASFILTSAVLLLIFISNQFAHYLSLTAAGKIIGWQLLHLVLLEIPQLLSLILPLAFYLGILLSYGRLQTDNEMVILASCGLGQRELLRFTLRIALLVAILVLLMTCWLNPLVATTRNQLLSQINATSVLQYLLPGRFQQTNGGQQIFYVESMSSDHQQLKNVFLAQQNGVMPQSGSPVWTVMAAAAGHHFMDGHDKSHFIVADNGYRYEGVPGTGNFTLYHFDHYGIRVDLPSSGSREDGIDAIPTLRLWHLAWHHDLEAAAELQWRLSLPLCLFILTLIAFALAQGKPRQGRFANFFPAILLYIIYANFMIIGQDWITHGKLSPHFGLWSLHAIMLCIGLILYAHQTGSLQRWRYKPR